MSAPTEGDAARFEGAAVPLRVLVVDDEPAMLAVMTEALQVLGHAPTAAPSAAAALDALVDRGPYDAVLSDVGMPDMSGWELAAIACAYDPTLPFIMMTGLGPDPPADVVSPNIRHVLSKPVDLALLQGLLRRLSGGEPPDTRPD